MDGGERDMSYIVEIVIAIIAFCGTALGAFAANKKQTALISYRLEQLEKKVDLHNQVIERTYKLEEQAALMDERLKVANHRIDDLEKGDKS